MGGTAAMRIAEIRREWSQKPRGVSAQRQVRALRWRDIIEMPTFEEGLVKPQERKGHD